MGKRLTVLELAAKRDVAALIGAAESTLEAHKVADRERSGLLIRQNGTLVRKKKRDGVYVSAVKSQLHSTSVTQRPQVQTKPAPEVTAWDAMVRADRVLVAAGCRSALVRVVKGPRVLTIGDAAKVEILTDMQPSKDTDLMARLRAMVAVSTAE